MWRGHLGPRRQPRHPLNRLDDVCRRREHHFARRPDLRRGLRDRRLRRGQLGPRRRPHHRVRRLDDVRRRRARRLVRHSDLRRGLQHRRQHRRLPRGHRPQRLRRLRRVPHLRARRLRDERPHAGLRPHVRTLCCWYLLGRGERGSVRGLDGCVGDEFVEIEGTTSADRQCAPCPAGQTSTGPNASSCERGSFDSVVAGREHSCAGCGAATER